MLVQGRVDVPGHFIDPLRPEHIVVLLPLFFRRRAILAMLTLPPVFPRPEPDAGVSACIRRLLPRIVIV